MNFPITMGTVYGIDGVTFCVAAANATQSSASGTLYSHCISYPTSVIAPTMSVKHTVFKHTYNGLGDHTYEYRASFCLRNNLTS